MSIEFLTTDFEKVSYLLNLLVAHATGKSAESSEYEALRHQLLSDPEIAGLLPAWVKTHRNLDSFWGFIQPKFRSYAERRTYLSEQFTPLLDALESDDLKAIQNSTSLQTTARELRHTQQAQGLYSPRPQQRGQARSHSLH